MALETLSSSTDLFNFIMYEEDSNNASTSPQEIGSCSSVPHPSPPPETTVLGRKRRRRRPKVCKNKEEAETQRMTHIAVERNRRKQMNEHLAALRSLMPESYVQRGDQASIVGGAIEFVKELEHMLQSLEAKKFALLEHQNENHDEKQKQNLGSRFGQFSCSHSQVGNKYTSQTKAAMAEIEVTLIETHANIRILSGRMVRQLSRLVSSLHSVSLTVLHLNVTTLDSLVLYSINAKVEEGCQLNTADNIAGAVRHMVRIIEEEAILGCHT